MLKSTYAFLKIKIVLIRMYIATLSTITLTVLTLPVNGYIPITSIIFRRWARNICRIGKINIHTEGMQWIDKNKNYLFISNHANFFDIPILLSKIPNDIKMFAKNDLFKLPLIGKSLRLGDYLSIKSGNQIENAKALRQGIEYLKKDKSLLIFPEGGRYKTGKIEPLKKGFLTLFYQSDVELVPIVLIGADKIINKDEQLLENKQDINIQITILSPINKSQFSNRQDCLDYVQTQMQEIYLKYKMQMINDKENA